MLSYTFQLADSIGGRTEQQDSAGAVATRYGLLVLVCDGMGGARGGATASRMAVDIIQKYVQQATEPDGATALTAAIRLANREIFSRSQHDDGLRGMGTTVTALLLQETHATLAHAGDSRIYQLRKGRVVYRTADHSKVFELVKRGILSEEQARLSEESNVILRALGIKPEVEVELLDHQPYQKGDRFLLCTDGISGAVAESQLLEWLDSPEPVETLAPKLVQQVDAVGFRAGGGHDNLTAALVECRSSATATPRDGVTPPAISRWLLPGVLMALLVAYLGYDGLVQRPRFAENKNRLTQENARLRRERSGLKHELDSLRRLLSDPALQEPLRRLARKNRETGQIPIPSAGMGNKGLVPVDRVPRLSPDAPLPPDSLGKSHRPLRPGTLVSPARVRATGGSR